MPFDFHAGLVWSETLPLRLSFLDRDDDRSQHYFIMDRSEGAPGEAVPEMGDVYIERDDQQWGGYGGIGRVVLERARLSLRLGPGMATRMGEHDEIGVTFDLGDAEFRQLRHVLGLIMRGYEDKFECRA